MGIGRIIEQSKVKKTDMDTYWVEIDGLPVDKVHLKKSREVALEPSTRRVKRPNFGERHKVRSARVDPNSGGILEYGIQVYRLWFQFLKLALELEEFGVTTLVTKQGARYTKGGGGAGSIQYKLKDTVPLKIRKEKYEGWDLDQVLNDTFDRWWKTHSYLFEGHAPTILQLSENLNPDFLYIRIDKTSKLADVRDFITAEVQPKITGKPRFAVDGYPRPDVIQNRYNALVLTLKGWDARDICEGGTKEHIYLRSTDPRSKDDKGKPMDRLKVGVTAKGKVLWSSTVSKQRTGGLHHLQDVMKGKFGDVPDKEIKK